MAGDFGLHFGRSAVVAVTRAQLETAIRERKLLVAERAQRVEELTKEVRGWALCTCAAQAGGMLLCGRGDAASGFGACRWRR